MQNLGDSVSIDIQTGVYNQFRFLNNKVWYALGEYVDNAVQSFEDNQEHLKKNHGGEYRLEIKISIDKDQISITDNAAGIGLQNYYRAFEPANIPADNTGLHEYGMGMKTASIWLADLWSVRTKALGESEERFIQFDVKKVVDEKKKTLNFDRTPKPVNEHYTEITLNNLSFNAPVSGQFPKIKKHLTSIYRMYIREKKLDLYFNGELLKYIEPEILIAPHVNDTNGKDILWKKEISFSLGDKYSAKGFIGILKTMNVNQNGISLFRRGRVIVGSHDEKYRPKVICGQEGSPRYKRIFGELELEGFSVSFNKGSFVELADLDILMEGIKAEISNKDFDLYNQAQKYIKPKTKKDNAEIAQKLAAKFKKPESSNNEIKKPAISIPSNKEIEVQTEIINKVKSIGSYRDIVKVEDKEYELICELIDDDSSRTLYSVSVKENSSDRCRAIYKVNMGDSFFKRFGDKFQKEEDYQPIVSIIKYFVLAELCASDTGTSDAGNMRHLFNSFSQDD